MPKYYVESGDLKKIIDRANPEIAAIDTFRTLAETPVETLNSTTIVSEEGFDSNSDNDWLFSTIEILEQSNQIGNYKIN